MNKKQRTLVLLAAAFVLLLVLASLLYARLGGDSGRLMAESAPSESTPAADPAADAVPTPTPALAMAPDFTVYDADGEPVRLSDFRGTPVVINFWASWCGPCQSEMPAFDAAAAEYEGQVRFLMINLTDGSQETQATAQAFLDEQGYAFPVYFDLDLEAASAYGVYGIPVTYFVDAEGRAVAQARSAISAEVLEKGIGMILPATAETAS